MTETAYPLLDRIQNIFKSLVWDNLIEAGLNLFFIQYPFLKTWPFGPLISYVTKMFGDQLFTALKLAIDIEAILLINAAHREAYERASLELKIIAYDEGIESQKFLEARDGAKKALSHFTRLGGI